MKRFLVLSLAALCVAALFPQSLSAGVGLKGGYALSKFSVTDPEAPSFMNLPAPIGGIFFNFGLGPLAIQPEVLYARMGAKADMDGATLEYRLDYIYAPVLLKLRVVPVGPVRPIIYVGGYGSYLLNAKGVMTFEGQSEEADVADMFEKTDFGVVGGAGIEFKLPGIMISVEGRYNYGLRNIATGEGGEGKNRSMMALVGIGF
jgi:Outer membrane protein beta-barrel domain